MKLNKKNIELAGTALLAILLLSLVFTGFKKGKKLPAEDLNKKAVNRALEEKSKWGILDKKFSKMEWKRDPFAMVTVKAYKAVSGVFLKGIIWDDTSPIVIFGDDMFEAGDNVEGYEILEIKKKSVILSDKEAIYELSLEESLGDLK
ncbi:MAG: hypothetical protein ABIH08_02910 [Candidatus Omnitrophota bacterium]